MPWLRAVTAPIRSPILGSKPNSAVHVGVSMTPSRLMNSCTLIAPIGSSESRGPAYPAHAISTIGIVPAGHLPPRKFRCGRVRGVCPGGRARMHTARMETRSIGKLDVSVVGLGCNNFGGRIDEAATRRVVDAALDAGITLFDTADIY